MLTDYGFQLTFGADVDLVSSKPVCELLGFSVEPRSVAVFTGTFGLNLR